MNLILEDKNFIKNEIDLTEKYGIKVLGYFPYATKYIRSSNGDTVSFPRQLFDHISRDLGVNDNKVVIVCEDQVRFGTDNFAIQFKDYFCRIGTWFQIHDY